MFQPPFRTVSPLFPVLLILLLPAGGCSLWPGSGEIPEEETQPRPVPDSVMEEELQDLRRRVEVLENKLVPGSPVPPPPPGKPAPAKPQSAPVPKPAAPASAPSTPASSAPASPAPSPDVPAAGTGAPGALPSPFSPAPENAVPASPLPAVSESTPVTPVPSARPSAAPARTEQNAYDMALGLYRTGRFAQAEKAFQAFLEAYPNSRLTPNALYWIGETFYSRGMFSDAIFAFKDVQARFPRHGKTPDSLLKTALAYAKLGDSQNAELHLAVLKEDWPKSEAATRAKQLGLF